MNEQEEIQFQLKILFDRISLSIQFLEKANPSKDSREIMERFIVHALIHTTDLNKENEDI